MLKDRDSRFKEAKGIQILIPVLILIIAFLVILFKFPSRKDTGIPEKEVLYFSFDDFHNMIGGNDQLPVSQKKELFSGYVGKYVNWVGEVIEIEEQKSGDFILRVKHLQSTKDYDVSVSFDPSQKEELGNIRQGTIITYTGKLFRFEPPSRYFLLDGAIK